MTLQSDFVKKRSFYYNYKIPGAGVHLMDRSTGLRDVTVGRERESGVLVAPAPGTTKKNKIMSSSPEDSHLILPSPDQIYLKNSKDPPDFRNYQVLKKDGSISRTELRKKMGEDFILKSSNSGNFYKDYCNKKNSFKYLVNLINEENQGIKNYKYITLSKENNNIFNRFINDLDEETKEMLKSEKQFAFVYLKKKDGSFDMDRWKVYHLLGGKHTEDEIFKLLLEIYEIHENDCSYSEIYIFSTNSPCLARPNHVPCMIQAFVIAKLLYVKHDIKTIIGYLKPWGFSGPYKDHLSECPIKDFIPNYESQTLGSKDRINNSPQTPINKKEVDKELLLLMTVYKQIIPDGESQIFSMIDTEDIKSTKTKILRPKLDLAQFYLQISKPEIKVKFIEDLLKILSDLFKPEESDKTFGDFKKHGLGMFEKSMENIKELLIKINYANIYEEIHKYLKNIFFPWWDKKVEDAFRKFFKKETSCFLQKLAVCLFLRDITGTEFFFNIGYLIFEN